MEPSQIVVDGLAVIFIVGVIGVQNVNPLSEPVPPGPEILTSPVVPSATVAFIVVELTTSNELAGVPPKFTALAPVKFVPVIVTTVPLFPVPGEKSIIVGCDDF